MKKYHSIVSIFAIIAMIASISGFAAPAANAATVTSLKDTMSQLKAATASSHTIYFVTPTGASDATDTIIITFPSDFNFTSKTISTVTFTHGATTGLENTETLAASATATAWGAAFSGTQNRVFTLTAPTDGVGAASVAVNDKIIITYDSTNSINASAGTYTVTISGTFGDSGSLQIAIIADDVVAVTATVNPTLTFTISTNSIGFGALSSSAATYANSGGTGSTSDITAHTLTVATNAATGYVLTYSGATLTSGANTINVMSNTTSSAGTEQFGVSVGVSGGTTNSTIATGYANSSPVWTFVAGATTTIVSRTTATVTETIAAHYLANIAPITEPGSYSTNITYVATGIF